jgi:phosphoglycerol transferase MdoB-like AlkP superfamily enzyme
VGEIPGTTRTNHFLMRLTGHIRLLLHRLALALIFFQLARLLFFLLNAASFAQYGFLPVLSTFFYGLLFDISAVAYVNLLLVFFSIVPIPLRSHSYYQAALKVVFVLTNFAAFVVNVIDVEYFKFTSKRTGTELFTTQNDIGALWADYVKDYWYLALLLPVAAWSMWKLYPDMSRYDEIKYSIKRYLQHTLLFLLFAGVWVISARGGFYLKPIRPFDATRFVQAELIPLTINTPFQMMATVGNKTAEVPQWLNNEDLNKNAPYVKQYSNNLPFNQKNVVVIILESFGKEYVGFFNGGNGYTPFLDSLCHNSYVFVNAYANGKKSIEALPSILSSIPSLLDIPLINSPYQTNQLPGLGKTLRAEGYSSAFYHGSRNGTMGFDGFIGASGFGDYYGLNEYQTEKDFDGHWGIFDEPYLNYFAQQLTQTKEPFCAAVFTLSSHHPYPIPQQYKERFPKGKLPIHRSIRYADFALQQFFETAKKQPWYNNTLFVITADHSAENMEWKYQTLAGRYAVPLLLFEPQNTKKQLDSTVVSHADIAPTVLHYLHYAKPFYAFGNAAFDSNAQHFALHFDNGMYQLITQHYVVHFNGQQLSAVYHYPKDELMRENVLGTLPEKEKKQLELQIKAAVQSYHQRLRDNALMK